LRRFYQQARAIAAGTEFTILLDGKPLRTPAGAPLLLPTLALAEAIAAEWQAQGEQVQPRSMPMMQLAATAIDRVRPRLAQVIDEIVAYGATDLLCYRAERPPDLVQRQEEIWQPLLDWLRQRYDAHLQVTRCVVAVPQSDSSLGRLRAAVAAEGDLALAGLHALTGSLGSLVLALAILEGRIDAEAAFQACQLDETFQIERWGADTEAMAARESLRQDIAATARFVAMARV